MRELLYAPVKGEVKDITECSDDVFSGKMLGDGIMVVPADSKIVAPCDGKIVTIADTGHAVTMQSANGVDILIHVGIDTVEMNGKGFRTFVKNGETVKAKQLLIKADMKKIKKEGYDTSTMLIVVSGDAELEKTNLNTVAKQYVEVIRCQA